MKIVTTSPGLPYLRIQTSMFFFKMNTWCRVGMIVRVTDLHAEACDAYVLWRNFGKPRFGPLCQLMRRTRLSFKYAIRQVKRNEDSARADAMAKDLES